MSKHHTLGEMNPMPMAAKTQDAAGETGEAMVLREYDRKLVEVWGKEEHPHAVAYGWVKTQWDAAIAAPRETGEPVAWGTRNRKSGVVTGALLRKDDLMVFHDEEAIPLYAAPVRPVEGPGSTLWRNIASGLRANAGVMQDDGWEWGDVQNLEDAALLLEGQPIPERHDEGCPQAHLTRKDATCECWAAPSVPQEPRGEPSEGMVERGVLASEMEMEAGMAKRQVPAKIVRRILRAALSTGGRDA